MQQIRDRTKQKSSKTKLFFICNDHLVHLIGGLSHVDLEVKLLISMGKCK